jgi:hypothetical protein
MNSHWSRDKRFPHELLGYLQELRMRVRRYRRYGILPESGGVTRLRAHRGSGMRCLICGEPVLPNEPEIVIEQEPDLELFPENPVYRLHHLCHVIWVTDGERTERHQARGH